MSFALIALSIRASVFSVMELAPERLAKAIDLGLAPALIFSKLIRLSLTDQTTSSVCRCRLDAHSRLSS
ncbi:hypothetical protein [Dactylosporangium sp. NPDC051541]|uniref:hypothetical protein n=1 Tax=Dactylosporangium sp. NPDC051541 TaxID=3363977 RepID=UPI0037AA0CB6